MHIWHWFANWNNVLLSRSHSFYEESSGASTIGTEEDIKYVWEIVSILYWRLLQYNRIAEEMTEILYEHKHSQKVQQKEKPKIQFILNL